MRYNEAVMNKNQAACPWCVCGARRMSQKQFLTAGQLCFQLVSAPSCIRGSLLYENTATVESVQAPVYRSGLPATIGFI